METVFLNRVNLIEYQKREKKNVMALGFFDGLHRGHCEVIKKASEKAKEKQASLAVMSFFPHPKTILSNGKKQICYLMPPTDKEEMLQKLGVDTFYIVQFDKEFSSLLPEEFVSNYLINLGVIHAVAGFDFTYGNKGLGNMDRLRADSGGKMEISCIEKIEHNGEKISSTCIRERLVNGKMEELADFLGRPYEIKCSWNGESIHLFPYYTLPAPGIYEVTVKNKIFSFHTEIIVLGNEEERALRFLSDIPLSSKGTISITWNKSCTKMNVQTALEKELVLAKN